MSHWRNLTAAQAKGGDLAAARQTTERIADPEWKLQAFSEIAIAQAKGGDVAGARQAAQQMTNAYWKAVTLSRIADGIIQTTVPPSGK